MAKHDYRIDVVRNSDGEFCAVPSRLWKDEIMTPNLLKVSGPLNRRVWRYMKFEHFESMLRTQRLFVPRVDLLNEPFEGSISDSENWTDHPLYSQSSEEDKTKLVASYENLNRGIVQKLHYVSCWHMSGHESEMHWSRYGNKDDAVAVSSTLAALCTLKPAPIQVGDNEFLVKMFAGEVTYVDYDESGAVPRDQLPLFFKGHAFKGDEEFRVILGLWNLGFSQHDRHDLPIGIQVTLSPAAFFDTVIPKPKVAGLREKVMALLDETGFPIECITSKLERPPKFG